MLHESGGNIADFNPCNFGHIVGLCAKNIDILGEIGNCIIRDKKVLCVNMYF